MTKSKAFIYACTVCFNLTGGFYACLSDIRWRVERFL
jgi:hypothetical protein